MNFFNNHRQAVKFGENGTVITAEDRALAKAAPPAQSDVAVMERPAPPALARPKAAVEPLALAAESIADYRATAEQIGLDPQDIVVEEFRHFLAAHDLPTFSLPAVVAYMDELTAKDNPTGLGWHWCPVRAKDADVPMAWGRSSEHRLGNPFSLRDTEERKVPASDFYQSHKFYRGGNDWAWMGGAVTTKEGHVPTPAEVMQAEIDGKFNRQINIRAFWNSPSPAYTRTLPLHALKKIALIEREFRHKVVFLVTEYTTEPHITVNPDPFLMAVIPNSAVSHGKGRFIIDVWDEPGFGIAQMMK